MTGQVMRLAALEVFLEYRRVQRLQAIRRKEMFRCVDAVVLRGDTALGIEIRQRQRQLRDLPSNTKVPKLLGFVSELPVQDPYVEERHFLEDLIASLEGAAKERRSRTYHESASEVELESLVRKAGFDQQYHGIVSPQPSSPKPTEEELIAMRAKRRQAIRDGYGKLIEATDDPDEKRDLQREMRLRLEKLANTPQ
jgi:hypothetical protein